MSTFIRFLGATLLALIVAGSGVMPAYAAGSASHRADRIDAGAASAGSSRVALSSSYAKRHPKLMKAVRVALAQRGDRYQYGAAGPDRFDCSGLVQYSYGKAGIEVPRTSRAQYDHATRIAKSDLKRGDLLFFHSKKRVYHVGVFLGWKGDKALMVHSPSSGKRVERATPWTRQWWAATLRG